MTEREREDREFYIRLWQQNMYTHNQGCGTVILIVALVITAILTLTGCRSSQTLTKIERQDSVRVEVIEKVIEVHDTVTVEIPAQKAERTTQDSTSHLENDYALSDARINPDGTLTHTLETKPQKVAVPFIRHDKERETVREEKHSEAKAEKVIEYVEKPLTWWEQTQIYGLWLILFLLAVSYRKKIFSTIVRLFREK